MIERSEITIRDSWEIGSDRWIGISFYLPIDFQTSDAVRTSIAQIHHRGIELDRGGSVSRPAFLQIVLQGDRVFANVADFVGEGDDIGNSPNEYRLAALDDLRGRWTDFVIRQDVSNGDETLEIYMDGARALRLEDTVEIIPDEYYFKFGLYRSFVSRHDGPMPIQILYVDEVRMGDDARDVIVNEIRPVD
jgi:hypothetical protein